ncbi:MAG: bifunctional hydroxymethylpyrimidine kinase/phosphomethylpyrimidine kinase [Pyrinomonadaceae bacterium]
MSSAHCKPPVCVSVAGLDPSGGAGVIADLKTFQIHGCYGAAAITSLTFQNTTGVFGAENISGSNVVSQLAPIFDDLEVASLKTGMLPTAEVIDALAEFLNDLKEMSLVVDPVVRSTSGFDLIDADAVNALVSRIFPLALIVTPNLVEAERISGKRIKGIGDLEETAKILLDMGPKAVLIKGGHRVEGVDDERSIDRLFTADSAEVFDAPRLETKATHGTGCTLSAAISANLALGKTLIEAVGEAKEYVTVAISSAHGHGHGFPPVNHWAGSKILGD